MPMHHDVSDVHRALAALERAVGVLESRYEDTIGLRRLVSDVKRLRDDLAELGDLREAKPAGDGLPRLQFVPDKPYDPDFWRDADDEGVGGTR